MLFSAGVVVLLWSCASAPCPAPSEQRRIVQVNHVSGGDAPTINSLEVYESGLLRLNNVGSLVRCSTASAAELSEISSLADPALLEEVEWNIGGVHDAEWAQIFADGAEVRILLERPPQETVPLLHALDALFEEHFGRRYDMVLLSD